MLSKTEACADLFDSTDQIAKLFRNQVYIVCKTQLLTIVLWRVWIISYGRFYDL